MNAAKQAFWLFCTLIALACSGWYFASSSPKIKLDDKTLSQSPDTIVSNLTVRRFDETGKLVNYMQTPEMQHIPADNVHLLKTPRITIVQPGQSPWKISSNHAKAIHGGNKIIFIENVIIHQNKGERSQESTLKTERLTYFPKRKLALTKLAVSFEQPGSIVHSTGMRAYLDDKRVQLLSRTHAIYKPNHA
ncbi:MULTISPECIES: LPS export ABC transporter periplasmic protein LptC [unclassified Legionella]|uniref:LPS export ABC transporter periplasmic protein LptC n=1 Tax=unclassified Legionella TaxID=2622702 RepID=UPI0010549F46|nr:MULTISPECIES: LPS export ABC transporter periplasmic protein LptC [unclassified Legionella]MDI9818353.1 LPS export ABC transporter periplasmic protein LptC [Legionella sp. PL877]